MKDAQVSSAGNPRIASLVVNTDRFHCEGDKDLAGSQLHTQEIGHGQAPTGFELFMTDDLGSVFQYARQYVPARREVQQANG